MTELPPIIFLHGLATSGQRTWGDNGWLDLVTEADRSVLVLDIPGHGKEIDNCEDATFEKTLDLIEKQLPNDEIDAVGFSLGARLLLNIAARKPTKFRKLVVAGVGENLFSRDEKRGKRIANAISGNSVISDPESQYFSQLANATDINKEVLLQLMESPIVNLTPELLSNIACPVLVALGDKDFAGPATQLIEALPNPFYHELKGVDHFATPKDYSFIDETLRFLDAEPSW